MSVNVEFLVEGESFELGRILTPDRDGRVVLETLVPAGDRTVPFFWTTEPAESPFAAEILAREDVSSLRQVDVDGEMTLYAFDWDSERDRFFRALGDAKGHVLRASASEGAWRVKLRFPDHDAMSTFQRRCEGEGITLSVVRVGQTERDEENPYYGLTTPQREALTLAVERGYYDIPRRCNTTELGEAMGISDQAVTERLRRGIAALVRSTLFVNEERRS